MESNIFMPMFICKEDLLKLTLKTEKLFKNMME